MTLNTFDNIISPENIIENIRNYRKLDLQKATLEEVIDKFSFINFFNIICANTGGPIFRVRKFNHGQEHNSPEDLWAPNPAVVDIPMNRANRDGQAMLYCAMDPITAIRETNVNVGDSFSLASYHCLQNEDGYLSSVVINPPSPLNELGEKPKIATMILNDFMFSEFTRHISIDTDFQYKATYAISKLLLDHPDKDSLIYPSMKYPTQFNIVFKTDSASRRLSLRQVFQCKLEGWSENENPVISINHCGEPSGNVLKYKSFHPDAQKFELSVEKFFRGNDPSEALTKALIEYTD